VADLSATRKLSFAMTLPNRRVLGGSKGFPFRTSGHVCRRLFEQNLIGIVGHKHGDLPTAVSLVQQVRDAYPL